MKNKLKRFLNQTITHEIIVALVFFVTIPLVIFGFWMGYKNNKDLSFQISALSQNIAQLELKLSSTTAEIEQNITQTQTSLEQKLSQEKESLESKLSNVQSEVGNVSGTVNTLEKLSKTDPELLQKYSKVFFLNEHFAPAKLTEIPNEYKYYESRIYQTHDKVYPYLQSMLSSAKATGLELYVYSAYRSFNTQEALKGIYSVTYGAGTANTFSADQGYSEHQLGTTVDLITTGIGGTLSGFENTEAYQWLLENAHKFGFTLSYPEDNGYYIYEPWHWRFVGVKLATDLKNTGKNFYDMDQREIDEYLVSIFD